MSDSSNSNNDKKKKSARLERTEDVILNKICNDKKYLEEILPYLKEEYFDDLAEKKIFQLCRDYYNKYKKPIKEDALFVEIDNLQDINENVYDEIVDIAEKVSTSDVELNYDWVVNETEKFCKDRSLYNSLMQALEVVQDDSKSSISATAIPKMLEDSLSITFDTRIGHDYFDDAIERFRYYNDPETKIPFAVEKFNKITKGGFLRKTLNIIMGGTGTGKSLLLGYFASDWVQQGYNVLYITAELAEKEVGKRIDQHLLDLSDDELTELSEGVYLKRIERIKSKMTGKLVIQEYPNGKSSVANYKMLLKELETKKNFRPDIVIVDYMNIISSLQVNRNNAKEHEYITFIAEELRAFAIEENVCLVTATQTNRDGIENMDMDLTNTSQSMGGPFTADFFIAASINEELRESNQIMFKQLKNRYNQLKPLKFVVGIDYSRFRIYDLEDSAQTFVDDDDTYGKDKDNDGRSLFQKRKEVRGKKTGKDLKV